MPLLEYASAAVGVIGFAWLTVAVHEFGHMATGRIIGLPGEAMRVSLTERPPQVQLLDRNRWVGPGSNDYARAFWSLCPSTTRAWAFTAGGVLFETAVVVAAGLGLAAVASSWPALLWLSTSSVLLTAYVVGDAVQASRTRSPRGDFSAMWALGPAATVTTAVIVLGGRTAAIIWVLPAA